MTRVVVYIYSIQLSFRCWAKQLGFKKYLNQHQTFSSSGAKRIFFFNFSKARQPIILVFSTRVAQSFIILLLYSYIGFPLLKISFTIMALYIVLSTKFNSVKYLYRAFLLTLVIPYKRQYLKQQFKLKWISSSLKLRWGLYF